MIALLTLAVSLLQAQSTQNLVQPTQKLGGLGAVTSPSEIDISSILSDYANNQATELQTNGKYKRIPRSSVLINGQTVFTRTHEYVSPDGSKGYDVVLETTIGGKRYIKIVSYGKENRSRDWYESLVQL